MTPSFRVARIIVLVLLAAAVAAVLWRLDYFELSEPARIAEAVRELRGLPWLGPAYVAAYTAIVAVALPGAPLALIGGALFGTVKASIYVLIASVIGSTITYALAHGAAGVKIPIGRGRHLDPHVIFGEGSGFMAVFRLHLIPVAPFGLVNVAAAVADVPFWPFIVATAAGVLPGTVAYVYAGRALSVGLFEQHQRAIALAGLGCFVLVALTFVPSVLRRIERWRAGRRRAAA